MAKCVVGLQACSSSQQVRPASDDSSLHAQISPQAAELHPTCCPAGPATAAAIAAGGAAATAARQEVAAGPVCSSSSDGECRGMIMIHSPASTALCDSTPLPHSSAGRGTTAAGTCGGRECWRRGFGQQPTDSRWETSTAEECL